MLWEKEKVRKLIIGEVSEKTLEKNFGMIRREFEDRIKKKRDQLSDLFEYISGGVKDGLKKYISSINTKDKYGKDVFGYFDTYFVLNKKGTEYFDKLYENIRKKMFDVKDIQLEVEITDLKLELGLLIKKFGD